MRCKTLLRPLGVAILTLLILTTAIGSLSAGPIRVSSKSRTQKDFEHAVAAWRYRTVVVGYKKYGNHAANWDAAARKFIDNYHKTALKKFGTAYSSALIEEGKALLKQGCNDAIVLSCYGNVLQDGGRTSEALPVLQRAADLLPKSKYRKARACVNIARLIIAKKQSGKLSSKEYDALIDKAGSYIGQSMTDGSFVKGEQRIMLNVLYSASENVYNPKRARLRKILTKQKYIDQYYLKAVCGMMETQDAWAVRGDGWGNTVTPEAWKGFFNHLHVASKLLTSAWKMHPEYPEVPTAMIMVAMGLAEGDPSDVHTWFNRAVAAQFDYMPAYAQYQWALRPRWVGSISDLQEMAVNCYNTKRYDTAVPFMYVNTLYVIESETRSQTYWRKPETQKRLQALFAGYTKSGYGSSGWAKTMEAGVYAHIGKTTEAKAILKKYGSKVDKAAFYQLCGKTPAQVLGSAGSATPKKASYRKI